MENQKETGGRADTAHRDSPQKRKEKKLAAALKRNLQRRKAPGRVHVPDTDG
jgi:hypothetical protein